MSNATSPGSSLPWIYTHRLYVTVRDSTMNSSEVAVLRKWLEIEFVPEV